jgi:hypothetical protein
MTGRSINLLPTWLAPPQTELRLCHKPSLRELLRADCCAILASVVVLMLEVSRIEAKPRNAGENEGTASSFTLEARVCLTGWRERRIRTSKAAPGG